MIAARILIQGGGIGGLIAAPRWPSAAPTWTSWGTRQRLPFPG